MKTQPLRRTLGTASVILFALVLLVPLVGAQPAVESEGRPDPPPSATNPSYRVPDSRGTQLPEGLKDWPPILPPEPRDRQGVVSEDSGAILVHDIASGTTVQLASGDRTQRPAEAGLRSTPPFSGLIAPGIGIDSVFPPDGRTRVSPTTGFPWRTVAILFITFQDGAQGWCSGVMIGCDNNGHGYQVLTTGHCLYLPDHGWADSVLVVPALDESDAPFGYAWSTNVLAYNGWINNQLTEYDMGWVILDRSLGDLTGWMGRITAPYDHPMYTGVINTAGYPCNTSSSGCPYPVTPAYSMWADADNGRTATEYNHWYYMDTQPGQSGSPVWLYDGTYRYIMTIHTSSDDGSGSNHGTRLNQEKFDDVNYICEYYPPPRYYAFLPLLIRQSSQDPYEPNDTFEQAWGPLASGETYHAFFPTEADNNDFYYFNMGAAHSVELWLTDIASGNNYNLYLYDEAHVLIGYSGEPGQANEHIYQASLSAGKYYVRINRGAGTSQTQPYALRVVYQ